MELMFGWLVIGIAMSIYFLPAIVAGFRNHPNTAGIIILNFFLGWTLVGWVVAMVWSVSSARHDRTSSWTARDPRWANMRSE